MEWSLEGLERYHATLGRFDVPDQHPLMPEVVTPSPVKRVIELVALPAIITPPRDELIRFYISLLPQLCKPGDDPHSYGETAYADADLLARINERMYLGGYVAKFKLEQEPALAAIAADAYAVRDALCDSNREAAVIERARTAAMIHGLSPDLMAAFFRWMIDQTIDLEVRFVQQVAQMRP
jgi:chorismate mutase